ncbi:MAG: YkgJ family cysteine cluster protein [Gammaproteobacteria bacterium]|nr:YkgJ family cysteine cluster protein [Gammaproteobacteria bacterium]
MIIKIKSLPEKEITCSNCDACCCRLRVMLITDTGVPDRYIEIDEQGGRSMAQLDDGWCAALDRDTLMCTIYDRRPFVCREFEMGEYECIAERAANM